MFRTNTIKSFSTRNKKQTKEVPTTKKVVNQNKKKVPVLKETTDEPQLIKSFELVTGTNDHKDQLYKMVINPTFYNSFYKDHFTFVAGGVISHIDFDFTNIEDSTIAGFLSVISDAVINTDNKYGNIEIEFEKLTWFTAYNNLNIYLTNKNVTTLVNIRVPGSPNSIVKTFTITYTDENKSTIDELQIIKASVPEDITDLSTIKIPPVQWNENVNFNSMVTNITSLNGNFEKLKLTNFKYEEQNAVSGNMETNLVVKGTMTGIMEKMSLPITVENNNLRWQITSINQAVNAGSDENPKLIGIDNEFASGATISLNDSSISFLGVELTEQQKTEEYWKDFYVNKITRYSNQVFGFKFQGYRGTVLGDATEEVVTIAPATGVSIANQVLTINFGNQEPGFLGETEEINMGTEANPNNVEAVAIYLDEQMSAQVRDNMNNVSTVKLVVSNMRVITQQTEPNVDCFVKRVVDGTTVEPTYLAVYYLNASNVYSKHTEPIENLTQQITNLNVIYGEVVEEGEEDNKKKLLTPATITSVWSDNKLNLETITPKGDVSLSVIQTTNCLAINAKLNLVVQGEMPFEWYDKWLPLDNVYVSPQNKTVVVDPTSTTGLTRLYSINDLPDATTGDEIGIKTVKPDDFDEPATTDVYSWMDMTRLADFTSVNNKINNLDDKTIFFVNMIKIRDELKDVQNPFEQWNGTTKEESWIVPVEMKYTELITQISVEEEKPAGAEAASNYLTITFADQTEGLFLDPEENERSLVLDVSDNENLSLEMSQSLGSFTTETIPVMLSVDKMRLISDYRNRNFNQQFYSTKLQSIEIRYLGYEKVEDQWVSSGIVNSYVINTADNNNKVVNRIKNLITILGTVSTVNEQELLEPIEAMGSSAQCVFRKVDNKYQVVLPLLNLTYTNEYIVPAIKEVRGVNVYVRLIDAKFEKGFINIVVKGEIPSELYGCIDENGYLTIDKNDKIVEPELSQKRALKDGEISGIIDQINGFPDEDIGINNSATANQNSMDLSGEELQSNDPKLKNVFLDNVTVSPSTSADIQMQFTRHVGLQSEGSVITIKKAQGGEGVNAPVDDPLVPLIESVSNNSINIKFSIKANNRGTLLVQNRVNYGSTDSSKPVQPGNIIIDLTDNKELSKGMKGWQDANGTTIEFLQEAVILQDDKWTASENATSPDVRLNGNEPIESITIKWYDEGDSTSTPVVEPSYKSVTFRMTPTEGSEEKKLTNIVSTISKLYLVNGTINYKRLLTSAYPAVDDETDETIKGIFKEPDSDSTAYRIEGVPQLEDERNTHVTGNVYLYTNNVIATGNTETPTTLASTTIDDYYTTNVIKKNETGINVFNNLMVKGDIPKWAFEQFDDSTSGYSLIQQDGNTDKWTITESTDANVNANIRYVNTLPVNGYNVLDIGFKDQSILGSDEPLELEKDQLSNWRLTRTNFHAAEISVRKKEYDAYISFTRANEMEYEGSTIIVIGGEGNVNNITEKIKAFSVKDNTLIITFKASTERNILEDYRDTIPQNIIIDITGDMTLCKKISNLEGLADATKLIIRQEALITHSTSDNVNIRMNNKLEVSKVTIKFFMFDAETSLGRAIALNFENDVDHTIIKHEISKLYFVYGTVNNHLLTPLAVSDVFVIPEDGEPGSRTITFKEMKKLLMNTEDDTQVNLKCEEGCLKDVYATNVINAIAKPEDSEDKRDTNIVVSGEIPYEIYRDFPFAISDEGTINPANNQHGRKDENSVKYPITAINDFPCIGYGEGLDIGISEDDSSTLKVPESAIPNSDETPDKFGKDNFYVDDVDFGEIKKKTDELEIMFTSHRGFRTIGSKIKVKPKTEGEGDGSSVMKVKSLNDLYNMMMEPRKYKNEVGLLRSVNGNLIQIPDDQIFDGVHLYYLKNKVKGKDRLILAAQQPTDYVPVYVIGDKGLTDQGDCVPPEEYMVRLVLAIKGTVMDNDFSMQIDSEVVYMKNINYGVVGNGAFEGSSIESIEVKGNKFNLKIEDIMNSICVRTLDEDTMEKTIKEKTEDAKKTKKIEMTKYIQYMKRVFQTMAYNKRYINEVLGYLSKCVSFEKTRLPSIREDNQGLESVSSEWSETNPNGWIEKFNEDFTQGGINYKVVSGYDYNYKFRDEGKHADLVKNMEDKLKGIYMFSLMERMSETDSEGTADNEYALMRMIDELIAVWLEYYKGVVTPDDDLLNQYSEIEIYEDEEVYKIFEATEEGETKVITCLTGGNEDEQSLETFIQGILEFFKDEIKTIVGRKEDINGFDIEEFVAYEDPMKGKTEDMISEAELNKMFQEDDNNLIEYSQMLSTIQGERNKLQRQGNKNKFILKFTQTYKGTFFELLGKETKNTDDDSVILGFFMSELKNIVSHERKRGRGYIPDKIDNKRFVRITKVPEFYKGDPLDWINDNYYCNKIFTQSCDNLYLGLQPEIANRITVKGTPDDEDPTELKEKDMIGYYMIKVK